MISLLFDIKSHSVVLTQRSGYPDGVAVVANVYNALKSSSSSAADGDDDNSPPLTIHAVAEHLGQEQGSQGEDHIGVRMIAVHVIGRD